MKSREDKFFLLRVPSRFHLVIFPIVVWRLLPEYLCKYALQGRNVPNLSLNWIIWDGLFYLKVLLLPPDNY